MSKQFKVGDKVRITVKHQSGDFYWNPTMDAEVGKEGVVAEVSEYAGTYRVDTGNGEWWYYLPESLELVEEVAPKFKVGDRVRNVSDGPENWYGVEAKVGDVCTVVRVGPSVSTPGETMIALAEYLGASPEHYRFASKYELVTEPATVYKVISTDYPECLEWSAEYASVEEAEEGIRKNAEPGRTFEIYSVVRTVHKTVKLTERTEVIRELEAV